jgi:hypothetical protein
MAIPKLARVSACKLDREAGLSCTAGADERHDSDISPKQQRARLSQLILAPE